MAKKDKERALTPEELEEQAVEELPEREAMSLMPPGAYGERMWIGLVG